jgi:capsule polysaccharide export protein KpsE/RkpR
MASQIKSLTDHIALWVRWRWFIIRSVFIVSLVTLIIVFIIPKTYRSTARFLPPYVPSGTLPFFGGVSLDIIGGNEVTNSALIPMLKSVALKDRVNARIDLVKHYKAKDIERAYEAFEDHLEIELETEESFAAATIVAVALSVLDKDPEFCAELVNTTVEEWNNLLIEVNQQGARLRRQYLEDNLLKTSQELAVLDDSLKTLKEKYGISVIDAQVQGTIQAAVALEQQIMEAKVQVEVLKKIFRPGHPELERAKTLLQELLLRQKEMQVPSEDESLLIPLGLAPEIEMEYYRLYRSKRTMEAIYSVLLQQFEQAKMQELREIPNLRVLDWGKVPINKYKPHRLMLVVMAAVSALFLSLLVVYFLDYLKRVEDTEDRRWIDEIVGYLRDDMQRLSRKLGRK